eukprot:scaffold204119_cov26-Tisochrysis_lutea.AAC.2
MHGRCGRWRPNPTHQPYSMRWSTISFPRSPSSISRAKQWPRPMPSPTAFGAYTARPLASSPPPSKPRMSANGTQHALSHSSGCNRNGNMEAPGASTRTYATT